MILAFVLFPLTFSVWAQAPAEPTTTAAPGRNPVNRANQDAPVMSIMSKKGSPAAEKDMPRREIELRRRMAEAARQAKPAEPANKEKP